MSIDAEIRAVARDEWPVVGWLWQLFRADLAVVIDAYPYTDGRYQHRVLDALPTADVAGSLVWSPHPKTGESAPIAFALVDGLTGPARSVIGFWVLPRRRRSGIGRRLALDVLRRHPGPWSIGFQHDNAPTGRFWRSVADDAFGPAGWTEERSPVPGLPDVPADHLIRTMPGDAPVR